MMRKIALLALTAASLTTVNAKFDGAFVSAGLLLGSNKFDVQAKKNSNGQFSDKKNNRTSDFGVSLNAGYNFEVAPSHILGVIAGVDILNASKKFDHAFSSSVALPVSYKKTYALSFGARYGYQFMTDLALFVGADISMNQLKLNLTSGDKIQSKKRATGFTPNLGLEYNLTENVFAGVKYGYLMSKGVSHIAKVSTVEYTATADKVREHQFTLSAGYRF